MLGKLAPQLPQQGGREEMSFNFSGRKHWTRKVTADEGCTNHCTVNYWYSKLTHTYSHIHFIFFFPSVIDIYIHTTRRPLSIYASISLSLPSLSIYIYLYIYLSIYLSLSISLSIYISLYISISLSISLHLYLSPSISLSISLSLYPSLYLSISISLSIYLSIYLSLYLYLYLSLSISLSISISIYLKTKQYNRTLQNSMCSSPCPPHGPCESLWSVPTCLRLLLIPFPLDSPHCFWHSSCSEI